MGWDLPDLPPSGVFESGVDASAIVKGASGLFQSGLNLSAVVKGTIGEFLSLYGQSGLDASAKVQTPSLLAVSNINVSGAVQAPSLVVASEINLSGILAATSGRFQSGADISAQIKGGTSLLLSGDINASSIAARRNVSANASGIFVSGLNTSGVTNFGDTVSIGLDLFVTRDIDGRGSLLLSGRAIFLSIVDVRAPLSTLATLAADSGIAGAGILSMNSSGAFQSGLNTSATIRVGGAGIFAEAISTQLSIKTESGIFPNVDAIVSIGTAALRWATVRAVSVIQNDIVWSDELCESCGKPFAIGETVALHIAGVRTEEGYRIVGYKRGKPVKRYFKETLKGGRPVHLQHEIERMVRSAFMGLNPSAA